MKWLIVAALTGIALACGTQEVEPKAGIKFTRTFLPPEQEKAYQGAEGYQVGGIDEETFDTLIDLAEEVYTPILKKNGLTLVFDRKWTDDTVNATCSRDTELVTVTMYGGLARHPEISAEGFLIVIAHELAHSMSIYPLYPSSWASSEQSADNLAVQQIARKLFAQTETDNGGCNCGFAPTYSRKINDYCAKFEGEAENIICKRSMAGALSLGKVLADLGGEPIPSFETPSKVIVRKTQTSHASAQCRLDQYGIAALCDKTIPEAPFLSTKAKAMPYICSYSSCWFKN
jgi:hypothetical protein